MLCHSGSLCAFVIHGIAERQGLCDTRSAQRCMIHVINGSTKETASIHELQRSHYFLSIAAEQTRPRGRSTLRPRPYVH